MKFQYYMERELSSWEAFAAVYEGRLQEFIDANGVRWLRRPLPDRPDEDEDDEPQAVHGIGDRNIVFGSAEDVEFSDLEAGDDAD